MKIKEPLHKLINSAVEQPRVEPKSETAWSAPDRRTSYGAAPRIHPIKCNIHPVKGTLAVRRIHTYAIPPINGEFKLPNLPGQLHRHCLERVLRRSRLRRTITGEKRVH